MPRRNETTHLSDLDRLIRIGKTEEAKNRFISWLEQKRSREDAAETASIALRLGLFDTGIRLLRSTVRPTGRNTSIASFRERAEYAYLLVKIGAVEEAWDLLKLIPAKEFPRVLFYRGAALVVQWNYNDSIRYFQAYLKTKSLDEYDRIVAEVNLAAAFVHEGLRNAYRPLLRSLLHRCSLHGYDFALGRVLEISAEAFIAEKKWEKADELLREAGKRLKSSQGFDQLYVKKFRALSKYLRSGGSEGKNLLEAVRDEAEKLGSWETVRDCDRACAIATKNKDMLAKLWFGTPFQSYRQKIENDFLEIEQKTPDEFTLHLSPNVQKSPSRKSPKTKKTLFQLDLLSGSYGERSVGITPGRLLHRLLICLTRDLYRPTRVAAIHYALHPDRFYHPEQSPRLVYDACYRLRELFKRRKIPLEIVEVQSSFLLKATGPISLVFKEGLHTGKKHLAEIEKIKRSIHGEFSLKEAVSLLEKPRRSVFRLLDDACKRGEIVRLGKARSTRYRMAS